MNSFEFTEQYEAYASMAETEAYGDEEEDVNEKSFTPSNNSIPF